MSSHRWLHIVSLIVLLIVVVCPNTFARRDDDMLQQKDELKQLQKNVEQGRKKLDSLQSEERKLQSTISSHDQKISSDRRVIARLNREMKQLKSQITDADSLLNYRQEISEQRKRRYLGNIRRFYMVARDKIQPIVGDPNDELRLNRRVNYLAALAGYESENIAEAISLLEKSMGQLEDLTGQNKIIRGLKKKRETSFALGSSRKQKEQKSLKRLRRKSMIEADHIIMLEQAAEEMAAIISRLEDQRAREAIAGNSQIESAFAALKGLLSSPCRGKVVESFGNHTDPVTKLKSFSPGIVIKSRAGRKVFSVSSGVVAYIGELRGYGNLVIINHDHQYYTTYAGLGIISVSQDQFIPERTELGSVGKNGTIRFELRQGRQPLDPVKWIHIESF